MWPCSQLHRSRRRLSSTRLALISPLASLPSFSNGHRTCAVLTQPLGHFPKGDRGLRQYRPRRLPRMMTSHLRPKRGRGKPESETQEWEPTHVQDRQEPHRRNGVGWWTARLDVYPRSEERRVGKGRVSQKV